MEATLGYTKIFMCVMSVAKIVALAIAVYMGEYFLTKYNFTEKITNFIYGGSKK